MNTSVCIWPTQGPSLQVRLPCLPGGLPAKAAGLRGQPTAPPGPSPRAAAPCRPLGAGRSSDPSWLPDTRFRRPAPLSAQFQGCSASPHPGLPATSPSSLRAPLSPPPAPGPVGGAGCRPFPLPRRLSSVPTWRGPRPWPVFSASGHLPGPPGPAPLPGGYSLKPLRISLARSSLADMMRQPPPAAFPRWPGAASQTMPRSGGLSRSPAWRPRASSGSGQTRTGLSLLSAPAPDPFSFPPSLGVPTPEPIESQPRRLAS